jgi:hypothetical protein
VPVNVAPGLLYLTGQLDPTPVTTKHEKRLYDTPLFAVSYGSFQGRPLYILTTQSGGTRVRKLHIPNARGHDTSVLCQPILYNGALCLGSRQRWPSRRTA